jgi:hypothetical protein
MCGAWFSSAGRRARGGYCEGRAPRSGGGASPPNKPMHPTADTAAVINLGGAARRVIGGVRRRHGAQVEGSEERG